MGVTCEGCGKFLCDAMSSYWLILIGGEFFVLDFTSFRSQLMSDSKIVLTNEPMPRTYHWHVTLLTHRETLVSVTMLYQIYTILYIYLVSYPLRFLPILLVNIL